MAPVPPRYSRPSAMTPAPIAEPVFTMIDWRRSGGCTLCSPTAMQLASFSIATGTPKRSSSQALTGNLFQPGMRDGRVTTPEATSTGPGRERPTPLSRSRPCCSARDSSVPASPGSAASGPSAVGNGTVETSVIPPPGSTTPTWACLPPSSAATANPSLPPRRRTLRGRPPAEDRVPCSATSPWATSWPTVSEIVDGAAPSSSVSSVRVLACPEASSSSTRSASEETPVTPLRCAGLFSVMGEVTSDEGAEAMRVRPRSRLSTFFRTAETGFLQERVCFFDQSGR